MIARTVLYHVTFAPHIGPQERFVATVKAVEDNEAIWAYHLVHGKHLVPDYAAIREALPHQHRKAYDRAGRWWFPVTLHSELSGLPDQRNACSRTLRDAKGRLLGTLYATPYLYDSPSIGRASCAPSSIRRPYHVLHNQPRRFHQPSHSR